MSLREDKKKKTRKHISDIATRLFLEKGFHTVTVDEIAARAEVSVPTLFKYFPSKVAMVFDEDEQREEALISAVTDRPSGLSILASLQARFGASPMVDEEWREEAKAFLKMIRETPELENHSRQMWARSEKILAKALIEHSPTKLSPLEAESIAEFILNAMHRAHRNEDPKAAIAESFRLLQNGWQG